MKDVRRRYLLALALLAVFAGSAYGFCKDYPDIACGARCRSVGGIVACYWTGDVGIGCTQTGSGCASGEADCCQAGGGF